MVGDRRYEAYRETGLVLMTHRYYDPETGRFLTRDSIGYAGGVNLYGYVQGNPVNWVDPWGLSKDSKPRKKWRDRYNEAKAAATVALSSAGALVGHYIDKTGRGAAVGGAIGLGMGVVGGFLDYKAYKCAAEHQGRRLWGGRPKRKTH